MRRYRFRAYREQSSAENYPAEQTLTESWQMGSPVHTLMDHSWPLGMSYRDLERLWQTIPDILWNRSGNVVLSAQCVCADSGTAEKRGAVACLETRMFRQPRRSRPSSPPEVNCCYQAISRFDPDDECSKDLSLVIDYNRSLRTQQN